MIKGVTYPVCFGTPLHTKESELTCQAPHHDPHRKQGVHQSQDTCRGGGVPHQDHRVGSHDPIRDLDPKGGSPHGRGDHQIPSSTVSSQAQGLSSPSYKSM